MARGTSPSWHRRFVFESRNHVKRWAGRESQKATDGRRALWNRCNSDHPRENRGGWTRYLAMGPSRRTRTGEASAQANLLRADLNYLLAKGELDVATGVAPNRPTRGRQRPDGRGGA